MTLHQLFQFASFIFSFIYLQFFAYKRPLISFVFFTKLPSLLLLLLFLCEKSLKWELQIPSFLYCFSLLFLPFRLSMELWSIISIGEPALKLRESFKMSPSVSFDPILDSAHSFLDFNFMIVSFGYERNSFFFCR